MDDHDHAPTTLRRPTAPRPRRPVATHDPCAAPRSRRRCSSCRSPPARAASPPTRPSTSSPAGLAARDLGGVPLDDPAAAEQLAAIWAAVPEDQAGHRGGRRGDHRGRHRLRDPRLDVAARRRRVDLRDPRRGDPGRRRLAGRRGPRPWSRPTSPRARAWRSAACSPERGQVLGAGDATIVGPRPVVRLGLDKTQAEPGAVDGVGARHRPRARPRRRRLRRPGRGRRREGVRRGPRPARRGRGHHADPGVRRHPGRRPPRRRGAARAHARVRGPAARHRSARPPPRSSRPRTARSSPATSSASPGSRRGTTSSCAARPASGSSPPGARPTGRSSSRHRPPASRCASPSTPALQQKAEQVLAGTGPVSALVAIRPSSGDILAAANGPGNDGLNAATFGQYAPGSTFKVVSSLALLRAGLAPETPVACDATTVVDGKTFKNYDDYPASGHRPDHPAAGRRQLVQHRLHLRARPARRRRARRGGRVARPRDRPRPRLPGVLRPGPAARGRDREGRRPDRAGHGPGLPDGDGRGRGVGARGHDGHAAPRPRPRGPRRRRADAAHAAGGRAAPRPHAGRGHRGLGRASWPTCPARSAPRPAPPSTAARTPPARCRRTPG